MEMKNIILIQHTPDHLRALIDGTTIYEERFAIRVAPGVRELLTGPEVSPEFRERVNNATVADEWKDGFGVIHCADNVLIGFCSFTGPPGNDGTVEIAYGIATAYQNRGHATEAAQALIARALSNSRVHAICAHTLPEENASTRILKKCGFALVGEVIHPEDGLIWRWEL
jgi:ribosomal-protein-alanine N-acetyltransferase